MFLSILLVFIYVYEDNCLICFIYGNVVIEIVKGLWKENWMWLNDVCFFVVDFVVLIGFLFNRVCVRNKRIILFRDYLVLLILLLLISLVSCYGNFV